MLNMNLQDAMNAALMFVMGGGAAAMFAKRSMRSISFDGAQIDIVEQLRREVKRLAAQNTKLAHTLNQLQTEMVNVRMENAELRTLLKRLGVAVEEIPIAPMPDDDRPPNNRDDSDFMPSEPGDLYPPQPPRPSDPNDRP